MSQYSRYQVQPGNEGLEALPPGCCIGVQDIKLRTLGKYWAVIEVTALLKHIETRLF
ncbi:hypothetical protein [Chlorogloeopsis fritschii]|uniref:hypothetical protein n=1 Tax=Chlorogloeopsis fritschii TaxID=1124 RepID=UPI0023F366CE|nr:hypothetical protein [Chlorogloeopsis fritschii]